MSRVEVASTTCPPNGGISPPAATIKTTNGTAETKTATPTNTTTVMAPRIPTVFGVPSSSGPQGTTVSHILHRAKIRKLSDSLDTALKYASFKVNTRPKTATTMTTTTTTDTATPATTGTSETVMKATDDHEHDIQASKEPSASPTPSLPQPSKRLLESSLMEEIKELSLALTPRRSCTSTPPSSSSSHPLADVTRRPQGFRQYTTHEIIPPTPMSAPRRIPLSPAYLSPPSQRLHPHARRYSDAAPSWASKSDEHEAAEMMLMLHSSPIIPGRKPKTHTNSGLFASSATSYHWPDEEPWVLQNTSRLLPPLARTRKWSAPVAPATAPSTPRRGKGLYDGDQKGGLGLKLDFMTPQQGGSAWDSAGGKVNPIEQLVVNAKDAKQDRNGGHHAQEHGYDEAGENNYDDIHRECALPTWPGLCLPIPQRTSYAGSTPDFDPPNASPHLPHSLPTPKPPTLKTRASSSAILDHRARRVPMPMEAEPPRTGGLPMRSPRYASGIDAYVSPSLAAVDVEMGPGGALVSEARGRSATPPMKGSHVPIAGVDNFGNRKGAPSVLARNVRDVAGSTRVQLAFTSKAVDAAAHPFSSSIP